MATRTIHYRAGNEHNPGDPFGRTELVIRPDGSAWLDHIQMGGKISTWIGQVAGTALDTVWSGLERAGFPVTPMENFVAGSTLRHLSVEVDGVAQQAVLAWHKTKSMPGYAEAFDVLDGVIRQLSGEKVPYPSTQPQIVSAITALGA